MALDWQDIAGGAVTGAGAAAGIATMATGNPVAGAGIMTGASALNSIFGLTKKVPTIPRASGIERVSAERANTLASRATETQGLTPQQVAYYDEIGLNSDIANQGVLNSFNYIQSMSPAEQQFLAKAIKSKIQEAADMRRKQLLAADAEATSASVQDALRATSTAAGIAGQVQEKDATAKLYKTQMEQQKYSAFMQDIGEAAEFVGDVYMANEELNREKAKDLAKRAGNSMGGVVMPTPRANAAPVPDMTQPVTASDVIMGQGDTPNVMGGFGAMNAAGDPIIYSPVPTKKVVDPNTGLFTYAPSGSPIDFRP